MKCCVHERRVNEWVKMKFTEGTVKCGLAHYPRCENEATTTNVDHMGTTLLIAHVCDEHKAGDR